MKINTFYTFFLILAILGLLFMTQAFETTITPAYQQLGFNRFGIATPQSGIEIESNSSTVYAGICWLSAMTRLCSGRLMARQ